MSVEHAVERTRCRGGVVLGGNGDDFAVGYTCYAVYGFCEVIPRCDTRIGEVIDSGNPLMRLDYLVNGCCEIGCVGG